MELNENVEQKTSPSISDLRRTRLKAAQIRLLYAQSGIGSIGALLGAITLGGALWKVVPHDRIVVWVLAYVAVLLGRYYLIHLFHRQERDDEELIRWDDWHTVAVGAGALLWGMAGVWLFPQDSVLHQFLLSIFVAGIAAAGAVIYSPTKDYVLNPLLTLLPLSGRIIYEFDEFHVTVGGVILLFAAALLLTGRRMHMVYADSLKLRYDKEELVQDLEHEIARRDVLEAELKTARDDLEMRVEARTAELKIERNFSTFILDSLPGTFYLFDDQGRIMRWNSFLECASGYSAEEIGTMRLLDFFPESEKPKLQEAVQEVLTRGKTYLESEWLTRSGEEIPCFFNARQIYIEDRPCLIGVGIDIRDRKRAEEALIRSEEKYRRIIENTQDVIYQTDMDGRIVFASPSCERLLGYAPEEVLGRRLTELYALPEERTRLLKLILENGSVTDFEAELTRKDGSRVWISANARLLRDEKGNPTGVEGVGRDVTARKTAEEELRESEQRLSQIINFLPDATLAIDREGRVIAWNRAIEEMTGVPAEEMMGKGNYEYAIPFYGTRRPILLDLVFTPNEEIRQTYSFFTAENDVLTVEAYNARPLGKEIVLWAKAVPLYDMHGNIIGAIESIRDITERKKAEKDLHESREMLQIVLDTIPAGVFWKDRDSVYLGANRAWLEAAGLNSSQQVMGKTDYDLPWAKDQANSYREHDGRVMESGIPEYDIIETYTRADGSLAWAKTSKAPLRDPEGNIVGILGTYEGITQRKLAEEALRQSEERYRTLFEAAGDGIFILETEEDHRSQILSANLAAAEMHGYTVNELLTLTMFDLETPECTAALEPERNERFLSGEVMKGELTHRKKDGTLLYVETTARMLELGDRKCVLAIDRDITRRKLTERALRESEEKLKSIFRAAPVGIGVVADRVFNEVNDYLCEMVGYSRDELLDKNARLVYATEEDFEFVGREKYRQIAEKGKGSVETLWRRKDGEVINVLLSSSPIDPADMSLGVTFTALDITEQERSQRALRESEEKYRSVVENMSDVVYRTDMQGTITMVSLSGAEMAGYDTVDEMIGLNLAKDFYRDPAERDRLLGLLQEKGSVSDFEVELARRDGNSIIVSTNSHIYYDKSGAPLGVEGVFSDITARKRAEQALLESEERYRSLFHGSIDAIYLTARDGTLVEANQAFLDLFGFTREESHDLNILAIYRDPTDRPRFQETIERYGSLKDYGVKFQKKDGTEIDCLLTFTLRLDRDGAILGYQGIARDMTEQRNLHKQLLQAQKMEAIGTLAGGIAHDFNNLLTVVMGFSELLLAEKDQNHAEHADLEKIFHAAKNGAELVQRLLMFSRKSEPKPVPMNLNKQIVLVEKLLRRTIPKMVDIKLELSADLLDINADMSQMEQVLMNLAVNARDAMAEGGKLTVRTDVVKLDEDYCRLHLEANPGEYVSLEVSDNGHGMDKDTVEHIFEPFFTTKEMGRGTGLGLAMVYGIVKQHNGHITVYSEVGKGTTFRVCLPAIPADAGPETEESDIIPAFGTETVLLVDDEEFVRELGVRILTKYGYTVLHALNGREALDLFKKESSRISLVILDLIMPEMGGTECLKELLEIDDEVNVIIASGFSAETSVKETIQMGAKGFVSKPFRVKELLRDVRKALDGG